MTSFPAQSVPDYFKLYQDYVTRFGILALLGIHQPDSRAFWLLIGVVATLIMALITRISKLPIVYVNSFYVVSLLVFAPLIISFDGAANYYNWYNPQVEGGRVDTWTHMLAGFIIAYLISSYEFESLLHLSRRQGWITVLAIVYAFAVYFEIGENSRPEVYLNPILNSYHDVVIGLVGALVGIWLYEKGVVELGQ